MHPTMCSAPFSLKALLGVTLMAALLWPQMAAAQDQPQGKTHALLLNGGGNARINFLSHLHHLEDMMEVLVERGVPKSHIAVFSSDGEDKKPDLATREVIKRPQYTWLLSGTQNGSMLSVGKKTENTVWQGVKLRPARYDALRKWFAKKRKALQPGDTLMVFVTDHGRRGKTDLDNGSIVLWNEEMSVVEFRALLSTLKPGVRVVTVMSQCFSGTFSKAIYPLGQSQPDGDHCGFYATRNDRFAYGCYPEGRGRDQIGHAFGFIDAMRRNDTLLQSHEEIAVTDDAPDVPLRSSDFYLLDRLEAEASARNMGTMELADELLQRALENPVNYAQDLMALDALAASYDMHSPRSVATVQAENDRLEKMLDSAKSTQDLWDNAYGDLLDANLWRFLDDSSNQQWVSKLTPRHLRGLDDDAKLALLEEVVPKLASFTRADKDTWKRLLAMRSRRAATYKLHYRLETRQAILLRMQHRLVRIAGEELLTQPTQNMPPAMQEASTNALERLNACEEATIGPITPGKGSPRTPKVLAELDAERQLLLENLPSYLGVGYEAIKKGRMQQLDLKPGAVVINRVVSGSPADNAGLKVGDIIAGAKGKPFVFKNHLRFWVMTTVPDQPQPLNVIRGAERLKLPLTLKPFDAKIPDALPSAKAEQPAPAIDLPQTPAMAGKRHLLVFWTSWSGKGRAGMLEAAQWGKRNKVPVIAISDEPSKVLEDFKQADPREMPPHLLSDPQRRAFEAFHIHTNPTFVLIDAKGTIVKRGHDLSGRW